jgi:hypothetical protein
MHIAPEGEAAIQQRAIARGWRALIAVILGVGLLSAVGFFLSVVTTGKAIGEAIARSSPGTRCNGCGPAPRGSAVRRADQTVGAIQQVAAPQAGRPLQMFLATASGAASGPVIDSVRAGQLAARLDQDPKEVVWAIDLVPRDSAGGALVGRLVLGAGAPIPVWGDPTSRP